MRTLLIAHYDERILKLLIQIQNEHPSLYQQLAMTTAFEQDIAGRRKDLFLCLGYLERLDKMMAHVKDPTFLHQMG